MTRDIDRLHAAVGTKASGYWRCHTTTLGAEVAMHVIAQILQNVLWSSCKGLFDSAPATAPLPRTGLARCSNRGSSSAGEGRTTVAQRVLWPLRRVGEARTTVAEFAR